MDFVERVLSLFDRYDNHGELFWRTGKRYGGGEFDKPASFFVDCNDTFWWACADLEQITPDNIAVLEQSFADEERIVGYVCGIGRELFAARVRGLRPQGVAYPTDERFWPLFDACGPERKVESGNPYPHPRDRKKTGEVNEMGSSSGGVE